MTDNELLAENIRNYLESGVDLLLTDDDYRTIIKALEQETCEDAISREAAVNACLNKWDKDYKEIVADIRALPPVTPIEPTKTGHWIYIGNSRVDGLKICKCSNCKMKNYGSRNYCPNCGAKMEVSE